MKIYLIAAILATIASGCSSESESTPTTTQSRTQSNSVKSIAAGVYEPYTREGGFQETIDQWGEKGILKVQRLREAAANTVAKDPKCDAVELSEISDIRSIPPNIPIVFVDCQNGERFFLGEGDVGSLVLSELERGSKFSSVDLIKRCTEEISAKLSLPTSFDQKLFSVSERQGTSGNRVVEFDFEAKNRLGLKLPAQARCIMTTQGQFEVTVVE